MIGIKKLDHSPQQTPALEALLSRQKTFPTPENNPQPEPETAQTNLPEDEAESSNLVDCDCYGADNYIE